MKILHTSDIHIDSPMTARLPSSKIKERRKELISNFSSLVACAREEGCTAVIIAGDLFDSESVSRRAKDAVLDTITAARDIIFFYLKGNHEGDALTNSTVLPTNLCIFGENWSYFDADGLTVAGRSACDENMFSTLKLSPETKNIVVLHGELRDRTASPEVIGRLDAMGKNIDYMALGHYHSHSAEKIDSRGIAVYSGTPEGRGFDEAFECGYVVIDTDTMDFRFVPFAKRRLRIAKLPLDGMTKPSEIIEGAERLLRDIPRSDLIRLELCGEYIPELWRDTEAIEKKFADRFYHFEVKDSSKIKIDPENYKYDKSFKGEFIRTVSADETLDEDKKAKIIAAGLYALMGENIFDN